MGFLWYVGLGRVPPIFSLRKYIPQLWNYVIVVKCVASVDLTPQMDLFDFQQLQVLAGGQEIYLP